MTGELTVDTTVRRVSQVMCRELDGEAVLLHLQNGHYYGLNEVGLCIWNLLGDEENLGSVLERLLEIYETTSEDAWNDLIGLIGEMKTQGLVEIVQRGPS